MILPLPPKNDDSQEINYEIKTPPQKATERTVLEEIIGTTITYLNKYQQLFDIMHTWLV